MAKKQGKKAKKKIDPLAISLKLLAKAERDAARALRFLDKAVLEPVTEPRFKVCKFQLGRKRYSAAVTSDQCTNILDVVKQNGDVLHKVGELLARVNETVVQCVDNLGQVLGVTVPARKKAATGQVEPRQLIALGCCIYDGGSAANLSKSQCSQYQPINWDPGNPSCGPTLPPD